jgi:acetyltransferase-like isoleucine patch superfamily enzyme
MRTIYYFILTIIAFPKRLFSNVDFRVIIKQSKIHKTTAIDCGCRIYNSSIGRYSYVGKNGTINNTCIGNFCSIADTCNISPGKHPIDMVSTSPVFYKKFNIFRKIFEVNSFREYDETVVGNDVWIGTHAFIKGGLSIGDGAIIGAYSVVTKDVPSFSIVAGNPAKVIRMRFDEKTIECLRTIAWWNWDERQLKNNSLLFNDVVRFIEENLNN